MLSRIYLDILKEILNVPANKIISAIKLLIFIAHKYIFILSRDRLHSESDILECKNFKIIIESILLLYFIWTMIWHKET